jgi:hypothetical protein
MKSKIFILLLLLSIPISLPAREKLIPFDTHESISPNNKFEILLKKSNSHQQDDDWYDLFFEDKATGKIQRIDEFTGYVKILWRPDSKYFFIIYRMGSNVLYARLYSSQKPSFEIDPYDIVVKKIGKIPEYSKNFNLFTDVNCWLSNSKYILCVAGQWNDNGMKEFEHYYELNMKGDVRKLTQKEAMKCKKY